MFCDVIKILYCASTFEKLSVKARFDASVMLDNIIRYQHVLTAITYLRITETTSALSKYLQTSGLDFVNALNMVEATKKDIQQVHRDFAMVVTKTDHFVQHANEVLEEQVVQSLHKRFVTHKNLFADLSYFDPKRFSEAVLHGIPISAVNDVQLFAK